MKGIISTISLLLLFSLTTTVFAGGFTGRGVKIGLNIANWSGDADELGDAIAEGVSQGGIPFDVDRKSRLGMSFGAFGTYSVTDMFAIQPEVFYAMKGVKYKGKGTFEGVDIELEETFKINYIEVPILFKFLFTLGNENITPELFVGPAISFKISSRIKAEVEVRGVSDDVETDLEGIRSTDFGFIIGGGVTTKMGILFDVRYTLGLLSIIESDEDFPDDFALKNGVISIMVGKSFTVGQRSSP